MKVINTHSSNYSYEEGLNMYIDNDGNFLSEDMLPEDIQERIRLERMSDYGDEGEPTGFRSKAERKRYEKIRKAYLAGDTAGIIKLAEFFFKRQYDLHFIGLIGEKEFYEAIEKAAKLGHIRSIEYITMDYYEREDFALKKNLNRFLYWARRGQKSEDYEFLYWLGNVLFEFSDKIDNIRCFKMALDAHIKAVKLGSVDAMLSMYRFEKKQIRKPTGITAVLMRESNKRSSKAIKAFDYLSQAAETGNHKAMNIMGLELIKGAICEKNEDKAFDYFEQIVNTFYGKSEYKRKRDIKYISIIKALEEFETVYIRESSGKSIYIPAFYNLGYCYEKGIGCEVDKEKAFNLYFIASKYSSFGKVKLAYCYENGIGVEKNLEEALKIYKPLAKAHISYDDSYLEDTLE